MKSLNVCMVALFACLGVAQARAAIQYSNGFEVNTVDWNGSITRVASGTGGVPSASGSFHATASESDFTRWGGYNFGAGNGVPTAFKEYTTSLDIYLNVGGGFANDTRFDFSSAINNSLGNFMRDFVFNVGFYNDASGPGAGLDRFVISASNNAGRANAFPKNPGRDPIAITTTGWYTFENHFYNQGGVLAVDLRILDSTNALVNTWTLSSPTDLIGGVGGNRYGFFAQNEFGTLPIDNASLETADAGGVVPEPSMIAVWSLLGVCGSAIAWFGSRRQNA